MSRVARAYHHRQQIEDHTDPDPLRCHNGQVSEHRPSYNALAVHQWLEEWDQINFDESKFQGRPPEMFLLASIPARELRSLSHAYRRDPHVDTPRSDDTSVQRHHETGRSDEIRRFVRSGYPLSSFSERKRQSASESLRKPGWLPTAIVVNILQPGEERGGVELRHEDAVTVPPSSDWARGSSVTLTLPESWDGTSWAPSGIHPIEVIDGQHRLWAFSEQDEDLDDYDLPVVAFVGLDFSWQAYLFWTINIKPKKINASLAYDLYPLLRDQDWLEQGEGLSVYRETRSQELTETLWSHPLSVWRDRINMLGTAGVRAKQPVTQAAFVRALSESFVRSWRGPGTAIGGLFGGSKEREGLDWNRAQQASFLIVAWERLHTAISEADADWASAVRIEHAATFGEQFSLAEDGLIDRLDPAFTSSFSLLASDQGVRGFSQVVNDIAFITNLESDDFRSWKSLVEADAVSPELIAAEVERLSATPLFPLLSELTSALATFDWRNSKASSLEEHEKLAKQALRGTGGYAVLRNAALEHVSRVATGVVASSADRVLELRQR